MSLHLAPRKLNPDAPEVWGMPYISTHAQIWLIAWYSARKSMEGVTVARGDVLRDILAHPDAVARTQAQVARWLSGTPSTRALVNGVMRDWQAGKSDPVKPSGPIPANAMDGLCIRCGQAHCYCRERAAKKSRKNV